MIRVLVCLEFGKKESSVLCIAKGIIIFPQEEKKCACQSHIFVWNIHVFVCVGAMNIALYWE